MFKNTPVAIIGMGCFFPKASGLKEFWRLVLRGEDAISEVPPTHWLPEDYFDPDIRKPDHVYCKRGGFLPPTDFDPIEFGIPPAVIEATDTSQLLTLIAAKRALQDAGKFDNITNNGDLRVSVILGATGTQELALPLGARLGAPKWRKALLESGISPEKTDEIVQKIASSYVAWQENSFPGLLGNVIAGRISNRLNLSGTNCVVDAACASSMSAMHMALMELASNRCDLAVTGGVDTLNDIFMHMCFARTQILSPTGDARPFSYNADGTVLGEGIGILVLKRLEDAEKDSDRIYAVIRGVGTSSDGKSQSIYSPRREGQVKALKSAYEIAAVDPKTVELIEAHGTGTRVGDQVEFESLTAVFGKDNPRDQYCALGSIKSNIGHTKAAAGSAGLIKAALALHYKVLPPTIKVLRPDPALNIHSSPFYLNDNARPWTKKETHPRRAGVSAFGFGGSNFHVVLEEYVPVRPDTAWDGSVEIAAFSSASDNLLIEQISAFQKALEKDFSPVLLSRQCLESRKNYSVKMPSRMLLVFRNGQAIFQTIQQAKRNITEHATTVAKSDADFFRGVKNRPGKLAFLFPGQGSQYPGMGRDFMCLFPESLALLEEAELVFRSLRDSGECPLLCDAIYPPPRYSEQGKETQERFLRRTDLAQPAIGTVSLAMLEVLKKFSVVPDGVAGHSFGELPALHAAGRIDRQTCLTLSVIRGMAMGRVQGQAGSMLAVKAPHETVTAVLDRHDLQLVVANRNAADQVVLSGSDSFIEKAEKLFREKGFPVCRLPVGAAFHSPLMENARREFRNAVFEASFHKGKIPVYANATGSLYPEDNREAQKVLVDQLVSPVDFQIEVETLFREGFTSFLEIGPKSVLTGLVSKILHEKPFQAVALDESCGRQNGILDLARLLCRLSASGYFVNLMNWERSPDNPENPKMKISLTGANLRHADAPVINTAKPASETPGNAPETAAAPRQVIFGEKLSASHVNPLRPVGKPPTPGPMKHSSDQSNIILSALKTLQEGLKSMQALQTQTTETHKKFLDTQAAATRALQNMIAETGRLAGAPVGISFPDFQNTNERSNRWPEVSSQDAGVITKGPEPDSGVEMPADFSGLAESEKISKPLIETDAIAVTRNSGNSRLEKDLIRIVSELTGYPPDTLTLEMDIEGDLGIDSIKRVEILSALEEAAGRLPEISPQEMGSLKTLKDVLNRLRNGHGSPSLSRSAVSESIPGDAEGPRNISGHLLEVVSELTGYPVEMLDLEMDIETDLGIDSIKRVEILSSLEERIAGFGSISPETMANLKTLSQIIEHVSTLTTSNSQNREPPPEPAVLRGDGNFAPAPITAAFPDDDLFRSLVSVISQLTGYPETMLHMDMDLEADLGIDSIKRVEILSLLEERHPGIPSIKPEVFGNMKTLNQICDRFKALGLKKGSYSENPHALKTPEETLQTDPEFTAPEHVHGIRVQRKLPKLFETPFASIQAVALPENRTLFVTDDGTELSQTLVMEFQKRGILSSLLRPDDRVLPRAPAGGLILLPDRHKTGEVVLADSLQLARHFAEDLMDSARGGGAVFGAVLRMDGGFGFRGSVIENPYDAGLSGLVKTASLEWPGVSCHAIDLSPAWRDTETTAKAIANECLIPNDIAPVEIGLAEKHRYHVNLVESEFPNSAIRLKEDDVILVTGGGRGVTSASLLALASRIRATFILLGRTPAPEDEPVWLRDLFDEVSMKQAIVKNGFDAMKVPPKEVARIYKGFASAREIRVTVQRLNDAGAKAFYHSVDVRHADQVQECIRSVRDSHGNITAFIHGAGILRDRLIVDKTMDQFQDVFRTKVSGFLNVMAALEHDPLRYVVLYSSVSGRFGNRGQVDYVMANEVLNKLASKASKDRPDCKVVSINWGPWDGGMVKDALKNEFRKKGIPLISPQEGAECLVREMMREDKDPVEVVIGASPVSESVTVGADDISREDVIENQAPGLSLSFKQELDLKGHPILSAHRLNGTPVVPLALMTEWISHGALHENPGLFLHGLENMRVLQGIKVDREKKIIRLMAGKAQKNGDVFEVDVEIRDGFKDDKEVIHTRARAILTSRLEAPPMFDKQRFISATGYSRSLSDVYENILFHGIELQGIKRILSCDSRAIVAELMSAPEPHRWIEDPMRSRWISDPLVLDSAFQMGIVWSYEQMGKMSLPSYLKNYRQFRTIFPKDGITAVFEITSAAAHKIRGDITLLDSQDSVVACVVGYEAVLADSLINAFKK